MTAIAVSIYLATTILCRRHDVIALLIEQPALKRVMTAASQL
jgi:hypothetical protein